MTDPIATTPEPISASAQNLAFTKQSTQQRIILFLNGLTYNALTRYPQAEVESWPIQRTEAKALAAAGEGATLAMAPLIHKVCIAHFGPADEATQLAQVLTKAAAVGTNSAAWEQVAAFVNGLRARTEDQIDAATTVDDCLTIVQAAMAEGEAFRQAAGL